MTPNPKHLEILDGIIGVGKLFITKNDALAAMQILQDEIDRRNTYYEEKIEILNKVAIQDAKEIDSLKAENERLKDQIKKVFAFMPDFEKLVSKQEQPKVIEHKLRELKNPKNPD